jgi:hypothetical protein
MRARQTSHVQTILAKQAGPCPASMRSMLLMTAWATHRFVCDELDGRFARMLNQSSTFGVVLDMVTDRCAQAALEDTSAAQYCCYRPGSCTAWRSNLHALQCL